jgi:uncharacterized protein
MTIYFADTSFWVALVDRRDVYHAKALEWSLNAGGGILTTDAVLLETANTFSRPDWRDKAIALINHVRARDDVEVLSCAGTIWDQGWQLFSNRLDKSWSLTDCISFEVMRERGLSDALAADAHFRQAGFSALLLDP